jgi:3-oxoadipate enol-lactonase
MDPYDHDLERGLRNRRAILGDAWVDKSVANANAFTADFQNFITRYAWHEVWGRPGLDARTRRVIVLAITCALGRWEEFELHLRASLTGGNAVGPGSPGALPLAAELPEGQADTRLTPDEVKEVLMQAAIYAGVPAANTGMQIAARLLRELGETLPPLPATEVAHPGCGRSYRSAGTPALHYTLREPRHPVPDRPTILLSHALGCDLSLWDALGTALADEHRVVCYDHRGHGDSDVPQGPYTMTALAEDADQLLSELESRHGIGPVVWIGLSLGGMVGQELALRHPGRLKGLVIANSSSGYGDAGRALWSQRMAAIGAGGVEAVADGAMERWFSPAFHAAQPAAVARWRRRVASTPQAGYLGACHAVMQLDTTARLQQIAVPTLVIAGALDEGTPLAMSQTIVQQVPGARLAVIEQAAHLSALEQPAAFEAAVRGFLAELR